MLSILKVFHKGFQKFYSGGLVVKKVYMSFSTDIIHSGHMNIIQKAAELGELTVGVLTDEVIATYKRYPLIPPGREDTDV